MGYRHRYVENVQMVPSWESQRACLSRNSTAQVSGAISEQRMDSSSRKASNGQQQQQQ